MRRDPVARSSDRATRPSEICRARLHAHVDAFGRDALPVMVREGDLGMQVRAHERCATTDEPFRWRPPDGPKRRWSADLAYRWLRSLRARRLRMRLLGPATSGRWWVESDGLRLGVFGHVATESDMAAVRATLHRKIDAPRRRAAQRIADDLAAVKGPTASMLLGALPLESRALDTLEALRWVAHESVEGATSSRLGPRLAHDSVDRLHTSMFDVLERLFDGQPAPARTIHLIGLLRRRLDSVRTLAERIVAGDESYSTSVLGRFDLATGFGELSLVVENLARLLEAGADGRDGATGSAAATSRETAGAVTDDTVASIETLGEPLRSRLRLAASDVARIERGSVRLGSPALRERLDTLVVRVGALLGYLATHPDRAEPARRFLVTHAHGLADTLESAAPAAGHAIAPLDLSRFTSEIDALHALLDEVLERLGREAQHALDVRLDVWGAQMRHERV